MAKWWTRAAAAVAFSLGGVAGARAQYLPTAPGPGTMPEPMPFASSPVGQPGMPAPAVAGPGGGSSFVPPFPNPPMPPAADLEGPNAFQDGSCPEPSCCGCYVSVGGLGLFRSRMERLPLAVRDPLPIDTGNQPPANASLLRDLGDIPQVMSAGVQASVGTYWQWGALELSGFWLPDKSSSRTDFNQGRLDSFFFNPPLGFEGDNGLWLQADIMKTTLTSRMGNAEANLRFWSSQGSGLEFSLGVRYLDMRETLSVFTDDDALQIRQVNGQPDPTREAIYSVRTENRILAPQFGLQARCDPCCWFTVGAMFKGAWGVNFMDSEVSLVRGDGFFGFASRREQDIFSHLYEAGLFVDLHCVQWCHLRAGYNTLWLVHVAEARQQFDYNLADHFGNAHNDGSIFYHGPFAELAFVF